MTAKQEHVVLLQVKLEFGHKASCRKRPTPEGFTHDWIVFVRGKDDKDISQFVDKVVFHLHESFQKPKRVIKDPPYRIEEHGYGSFSLPIDVYFKNKEEPKKVRIEYDLCLPAIGMPTIDTLRKEALKFMNPPEEFKKKVLKAGGEIVDAVNESNGLPLDSTTQSNVNGNGVQHSSGVNNGKEMKKEMKKEIKEEKPTSVNESEKAKKPKPDKQVIKTSNKVTNQITVPTSGKRPSDDNEVMPRVKKKKKKSEDLNPPPKPTGFIPIEPLPEGVDEQLGIGDNKDIKLKIKSLPSKVSKPSNKATDKLIDKIKEKKKEKPNDSTELNSALVNSSLSVTVANDNSRKRTSCSNTKTKSSKSPQDTKTKISKQEERKVEKLTFRRESGDSWSSTSTSNSPGLVPNMLGNSVCGKNNALGTLMAELSDLDDDDDEDIDVSTPFQTDPLNSKSDSFSVSNNNVLNKKDSDPNKAKTKTTVKKESKSTTSQSSKNSSKTVDSSKSSTKLSSKTKGKETNGKNGHQVSAVDLFHLHKELSSLTDSTCLQQVVDILEQSGCFVITDDNLEFDLYRLDTATIQQIQTCVKR